MPASNEPIRERGIFDRALELPATEDRKAFLATMCAGDEILLARLQALLLAHSQATGFLPGEPVAAGPMTAMAAAGIDPVESTVSGVVDSPCDRIGRYKLLEKIGEGGCGIVYRAEQCEPLQRHVAIKLIKPGMDTHQVMVRFEAERQALAMMDHPHIARIFDGGVTESGKPYFVMELVRGVRLTDYCRDHLLPTRAQLDLFLAVCSAVQHAHQKGIIHRDLKPSNILVTEIDGQPVPKVIDFGIAKATEQKLTDKTLFTQFAQFVGTPAYMSPEQAAMTGTDIDTRSDIYSLGVLLYELLTGTTPFDAQDLIGAGFDEMRRIIRETEPPKPSTRLTQAGRESAVPAPSVSAVGERGEGLGGQRSAVGGRPAQDGHGRVGGDRNPIIQRQAFPIDPDLDWIVMKCLEKDRTRRYETASGLAADIGHHLDNEPVTAAAPSRWYRLRKFVRRNKGPLIASATVLAALAAGTVGTLIGLIGESRQRAEAQRQATEAGHQAAIAGAVSRFQVGMLTSADPDRLLGDKVTVLQAVTAAIAELDAGKLGEQPLVEAAVRESIGLTLRALGRYDLAEPNLREALDLRRRFTKPGDRALGSSLNALSLLLQDRGDAAAAEPLLREALQICRDSLPPGHPHTAQALNNLALSLEAMGDLSEAEAIFREAVELRSRSLPRDDPDTALGLHNLAMLLRRAGRFAESEPLERQALEIRRSVLPPTHPDLAESLNGLALLLYDQARFAEAESPAREAVDICRVRLPANHPHTAQCLNNLALILHGGQKTDEAETLYREAVEIRRTALPPDHADTALGLHNLALLLRDRQKFEEAERLCREALGMRRKVLRAHHADIAQSLNALGLILRDQDRFGDAEPPAREALEICRAALSPEHPNTATALNNLAWVLQGQGKLDDAELLYREALALRRKWLPSGHPDLVQSFGNLTALLHEKGRFPDAEPLARETLAASELTYGTLAWQSANARTTLARVLTGMQRFPDAEAALVAAERIMASANNAPAAVRMRCLEAFVALHTAWEESDPGKGHAARKEEWNARLEASRRPQALQPARIVDPQ